MKKLNMSVPALSVAKDRSLTDLHHPSIELVKLVPVWQSGLTLFLRELRESGDDIFFSPHPADEETIVRIVRQTGIDLYYLIVEDQKVLGYGFLRGWDEGYQIPSLGIAIHSSVQNLGLGKVFMNFLHHLALRRGAGKVRLRVHRENVKAIGLYKSLNYIFTDGVGREDYLVGFKRLGKE